MARAKVESLGYLLTPGLDDPGAISGSALGDCFPPSLSCHLHNLGLRNSKGHLEMC